MHAGKGQPERARWEVIFFYKGKRHRKNFGDDLAGARDYYVKALSKGDALKLVTLRCCNMEFPPPEKLRPHLKRVRIKGKKGVKERMSIPLRTLNARGILWCGYCMQLRRFVERAGGAQGTRLQCPVCDSSHRIVAKWNPLAQKMSGWR